MWTLILSLVEAAIAAAPELIADVEALVSKLKANASGGDASTTPLAPQVLAETDPLVAALQTPVK